MLLNLIKTNDQILTKFICTEFNIREKIGIKKLRNPKGFIGYSQTIDDVYENLEDYNSTKKRKRLILFGDMIAAMEANKKLSPIVTALFLRGRKHYSIMIIPNKRYLQ